MKAMNLSQLKKRIEQLQTELSDQQNISLYHMTEKNKLRQIKDGYELQFQQMQHRYDLLENSSTQMVNDLKHEKMMLLVELDKAKNWASLRNNQVEQLIDSVHSLTKDTNGKH